MISLYLSHNYAETPAWWRAITGDLPSPSPQSWRAFKEEVDRRMIEHGGRYRQQYIGQPIWVTFRQESCYTMLLLRYGA